MYELVEKESLKYFTFSKLRRAIRDAYENYFIDEFQPFLNAAAKRYTILVNLYFRNIMSYTFLLRQCQII